MNFEPKFSRKLIFILSISALIFYWQSYYLLNPNTIPKNYQLKASTGAGSHVFFAYKNFLYFFKRVGEFPVGNLKLSSKDNNNLNQWSTENEKFFVNEIQDCYRLGERGKIFILWFDSLFRNSDYKAEYTFFNFFFFTLH